MCNWANKIFKICISHLHIKFKQLFLMQIILHSNYIHIRCISHCKTIIVCQISLIIICIEHFCYVFVHITRYNGICINGCNHTFFKVMTQLNAFIYEIMRCLLHQSHMPNSLWSKAIKIAFYILNHHITKSFKIFTLQ